MSANHHPLPGTAPWWAQQHHQQQQQPQPNPAMEPIPAQPILAIPIRTWHPDQPQQQPQPQPLFPEQPLFHHNNNQQHQQLQQQEEVVGDVMKEDMFEKILTPSDVGKLNRLVIPRNHAEEHLPSGAEDYCSEKGKGMLVNFEDETGKHWRFRYSYWHSSQSYVLTKGWTRYVKEKQLEAGDIVVFQKHRVEPSRLFVSWRRRPPGAAVPGRPRRGRRVDGAAAAGAASASGDHSSGRGGGGYSHGNSESVGVGAGAGWRREYYPAPPYPAPQQHQHLSYNHGSRLHAAGGSQALNETAPVGNNEASSSGSGVWLFGVNLKQTMPTRTK